MSQKIKSLFPTLISEGSLKNAEKRNKKLLADILALSSEDKMGREWCKQNYKGGYTSYASLSDLHHRTPSFSELEEKLTEEATIFAKAQSWNLRGLKLEMNSLWMNIMPMQTYHALHLHPHSIISGTYYVSCPKGSVSLKLEDPRMPYYMNAPARNVFYEVNPKPGHFILFESWLRHEVPPNQSKQPRISLSFNFSLVDRIGE